APQPAETANWNGKCLAGYAEGKGILVWYVNGTRTQTIREALHEGKENAEELRLGCTPVFCSEISARFRTDQNLGLPTDPRAFMACSNEQTELRNCVELFTAGHLVVLAGVWSDAAANLTHGSACPFDGPCVRGEWITKDGVVTFKKSDELASD